MKVCGKDIVIEGRFVRIARLDADKYLFLDDPESALAEIRSARLSADLFTFLQRLPDTSPKYPYPLEMDNLAVLPLTSYEHWIDKQLRFKARNKVRKGEKSGVSVREMPFDDELVEGIFQVYNESRIRQGKLFAHHGKDRETVRRMSATFLDRSVFIGAFFEGHMIGFAKLVSDETGTQAGLMHIVSMNGHKDKAPSNLLIAQAVRSCAERGVRYLVYSNFSYGKRQRDSLSDFKENNAFERVDLPRYYVPLTAKGRLAFRLGLHRQRLVDHIPESAQTTLRSLRNRWNTWRLQVGQKTV